MKESYRPAGIEAREHLISSGFFAMQLLNDIMYSMRPGLKKILKITGLIALLSLIILLTFGYLQYRELRKTLAVKISARATSSLGQEVAIEDVSFSPSAGINLYNIRIKNPEGFAPGNLLAIKRIFLGMHYTSLARGVFSFGNITVYSPSLTIQKDAEGGMNISEGLKEFFQRKSTLTYHVDEFHVKSGSFDFAENRFLRSDDINMLLKDLSSEPGRKTLLQADTVYADDTRLTLDGWVYLKDEPKTFNIVLSSKDPGLSVLKEYFDRYGIAAEKMKVSFRLSAEGDTGQGVRLASEIGVKEAGFAFFKKKSKDIMLTMRAFLNLKENVLVVEDGALSLDGSNAATLTGDIKKVQGDFAYTAFLKIHGLDLAAFHFLKDTEVKGALTSDNMRIRGGLKQPLADMSGVLQLRNGGVASNELHIEKVDGQIKLSPEKGITVDAGMTANILKVYGYLLKKPAEAVLSLNAHGRPDDIALTSSVRLSPLGINMKDGKKMSLKSIALSVDGNIKESMVKVMSIAEINELAFGDYRFSRLRSSAESTYQSGLATLNKVTIEGEEFNASVDRVSVTLPARQRAKRVAIDVRNLNASYPQKKAEMKLASLSLRLAAGPRMSGTASFQLAESTFYGIRTGTVKGGGRFDQRTFSLDITQAAIAGGSATLSMKGKTSQGPFPVSFFSKAEDIDIRSLSEGLKTAEIPYAMAGNCRGIVFEGTLDSPDSLRGKAEVLAEKVSVIRNDKRNIVQGASLDGRIAFGGSDLEFSARTVVGRISTNIAGTAIGFLRKDRHVEAKITQPRVEATHLRETFWDVFPDSLLYAGLEGSLAADMHIKYARGGITANGDLDLKDFNLAGENGEFSIGPVNGVIPVVYSMKTDSSSTSIKEDKEDSDEKQEMRLQPFERSEFENMSRIYSRGFGGEGYRRITIGSVSYGFRFIEDISIWMKQDGNFLNIGRFSGSIFGGRLNGSAVAELSEGIQYRAGIHLEGVSLTSLCNSIEPIKGYISGKVNGIATLKGSGPGISRLIGKAEFWSYATKDEKTKISKEFLKKMGGPSLKAYLGDRNFDKGIMSLYLQNGFVIFEDLEISNRNIFGMRDLSIKVAPFNNRIAIDHLMWSITEAASRAKEKK